MINYSISKGGALNCKVGNILLIAEFQLSIVLRNFGGKKHIRNRLFTAGLELLTEKSYIVSYYRQIFYKY